MSWTPTIWISRKDFDSIKKWIFDQEGKPNWEEFTAWEFSIAGRHGVAMCASSEITNPNTELHNLLERHRIKHWLINGEGIQCDECQTYGKQLDGFS